MIQMTAFWAICLAFYWFLLRQETYFQLNRAYLLGTLLLGLYLLLPHAPVVSNVLPPQDMVAYLKPTMKTAAAATTEINTLFWTYPRVLWLLYGLGCMLAFLRLVVGLRYILRLANSSKKVAYGDYTLVYSEKISAPFSFLKYVFIHTNFENEIQTIENKLIIQHEIAHIKQKHTFDILLIELVGIFFWWHPLFYFYKNLLRNTHEYLADAAATADTSRKNYGKILVKYALRLQTEAAQTNLYAPPIAHSFFHSQLQQRIFMLTKPSSATVALGKYTLLFPLFCGLFFSFTTAIFAQERSKAMYLPAQSFLKIKTMPNVGTLLGLHPSAELQSFMITLVKPQADPIVYENLGPQLEDKSLFLMQQAAVGDTYYFDNVIVKEGNETRKIAAKFTVVAIEGITQKVDARKFRSAHNNQDILTILGLSSDIQIESFELTYHKIDHDPMTSYSTNAEAITRLCQKAAAGDTYYFDQMVVKDGETVRYMSAICKIVE
jgi:beta-lactamase regulating signal transducer with metallopeptidase domain